MPLTIPLARVFLHRTGTLIEHKDYEINVLQHEAWTLVNRMQELDHMEALEEHRKTSKSLFPPSPSAAVPPPLEDTEEEIRRKYAVKHTELNTQIKAVAQLRAELTALRTEDHLRVSLTELVRTPASCGYRANTLTAFGGLCAGARGIPEVLCERRSGCQGAACLS